MPQLPEHARYLSQPAGIRLRALTAVCAAFGVVAVAVMALMRSSVQLEHVVEEEGVLELLHPWGWLLVGVVAALGCAGVGAKGGTRRDVWFCFWMAMLSTIAGFRELDMHVVLNPENIHYLGLEPEDAVHFRVDWWTSSETGLPIRIAWGLVALIAATAFFVPLVLARVRWKRLVLGLDGFAWTFGIGCGFLALGYVVDDIILRAFVETPVWGHDLEEGAETTGIAVLIVAMALLLREGHHARAIRRLKPRGAGAEPSASAGA